MYITYEKKLLNNCYNIKLGLVLCKRKTKFYAVLLHRIFPKFRKKKT